MVSTMTRRWWTALAALCVALGVQLVTPPAQALVSTTPAPMEQTNGPVWASEIAGGRIYVGGAFTSTRPAGAAAGTNESGQAHLVAMDASTGQRIAGFAPVLRNTWDGSPGTVHAMALSPDKATLYVGGDFNEVNGQKAEHLAAFDTATGRFLGQVGWNGVNGSVRALDVSPDGRTLYVGGIFSAANWSARDRLAAFDLTGGGLTSWQPKMSVAVPGEGLRPTALAVSGDGAKVFVGGTFQQMNGVAYQGVAAVNGTTGANASGFGRSYLLAPTNWATTLEVADGVLYMGGRDDRSGSSSRKEGVQAITVSNGQVRWFARCYGDTFDVLVQGSDVYVASHAHDCSAAGGFGETNPRTYVAMHVLDRSTGRVRSGFQVTTAGTTANPDSLLLSRTLASDGSQVVMGGGFDWVQNQRQANITRFTAR